MVKENNKRSKDPLINQVPIIEYGLCICPERDARFLMQKWKNLIKGVLGYRGLETEVASVVSGLLNPLQRREVLQYRYWVRTENKGDSYAINEVVEMYRKKKKKKSLLVEIYEKNGFIQTMKNMYEMKYLMDNNKEIVQDRKDAWMHENLIRSKVCKDNLGRLDIDSFKRWRRMVARLGFSHQKLIYAWITGKICGEWIKCSRCGFGLTRANVSQCYGVDVDLRLRSAGSIIELMNLVMKLKGICLENVNKG